MVELQRTRTPVGWASALLAVSGLLAANLALGLRPVPPAVAIAAPMICIGNEPALTRQAFTIRPPALRDAEPWPRGMVIVPPEAGDRIAIFVASDSLLSALLAPVLDLVRPPAPKLL
jgi:hypothetical protein